MRSRKYRRDGEIQTVAERPSYLDETLVREANVDTTQLEQLSIESWRVLVMVDLVLISLRLGGRCDERQEPEEPGAKLIDLAIADLDEPICFELLWEAGEDVTLDIV